MSDDDRRMSKKMRESQDLFRPKRLEKEIPTFPETLSLFPPAQLSPPPQSRHPLIHRPLPSPLQLDPTHPIFAPVEDYLPPLPPPPPQTTFHRPIPPPRRNRRNSTQAPRQGKSATVPPPFPWATNRRATVQSYAELKGKEIYTITGHVQCKRCERDYELEFDLEDKFKQVGKFIAEKKHNMHDRAPPEWLAPDLPTCELCGQEKSLKPIIADKKKSINWLFLLLGQMLGCCTLEQLKYFCKHTKNHRTGAKDRVLYLTYLGLCKQLHPDDPLFNRS